MVPSDADHLVADAGLVRDVLEEYGDLVRKRMQVYLPDAEPKRYLYELLADYPTRGGKMLRSSLCLAVARAWGGEAAEVIDAAVAIEMLHNALLVHDDVEDDSDERRGRPTLHRKHGVPLAVNAGDALGLLALRPLKKCASSLGLRLGQALFAEFERVAWESAEGQAVELGWQRDKRTDIRDEDYLAMVLQKTCWLTTICPIRVGCLVGARGREPLDPLIRLGFLFGAAFQIQDDLLNLEPGSDYGKEIDGDLREGKRTLLVIHALREANATDRPRLERYLAAERDARTEDETAWVHALMVRTGALEHARLVAHGLAGVSLREFDRLVAPLPAGRDVAFIRNLLLWVVQRTH